MKKSSKKLGFNKAIISKLQMNKVRGGEEAVTEIWSNCITCWEKPTI